MRKVTSLFIVLAFVALLNLSTQAAGNVTAEASTPIFSSNPIQRGLNVGNFDTLTSTSSHKVNFDVTVTATSDCDGTVYMIGSAKIGFATGETKNIGISWPIPATACAGTYTVTWSYAVGRDEVVAVSNTLTVTN